MNPMSSMIDPPVDARSFRLWRTQMGMTQIQAAYILNLGRRTIQGYELGSNEIPFVVSLACEMVRRNYNEVKSIIDSRDRKDDDFFDLI